MILNQSPITIFWFRRDLRLNDNCGLFHALALNENVLPIFIFDKNILDKLENKFDKRVVYIHKQLTDINDRLKANGSSLLVLHNTPVEAFKILTTQFKIKTVIANHDYEPYAIQRDLEIKNYFKNEGIAFHTYKDQVIFEKSEILKSDATSYTVFTPYSKIWKQKLQSEHIKEYESHLYLHKFTKYTDFQIPSLEEIGFNTSYLEFPSKTIDTNKIRSYHLTRNFPSLNATSHLSMHLRFGTLSIRELVKEAQQLNETWLNELIWREFFMMILYHFPYVVKSAFKPKYDAIPWRNNEDEFELWCNGNTGYPIVDAGMRELIATGFMHNRVRMIVASFLTKHLLIDWRWGEIYFAEKLNDYELSSNNGNWQWAAGCGCDAAPYFRIFNPSEQQKKFDSNNDYIRTWIPNYSNEYLKPMIDHSFARTRALQVYKQALNQEH